MSYSILIVDDSSVIRSMVRKSIDMAGLQVGQVHEAANGLEALEVLAHQWIDIVFADLNMPCMGGVELVEKMAGDDLLVSIPVVIVSAEQNPVVIEALKKRGIRAYLKKPFRPEGFRSVVLAVLGDSGAKPS
ncbi:MAG: response regulator [Deltaproteobacteria bacterium]|nr:response regulator [Deltaproteobacteria bacterium]